MSYAIPSTNVPEKKKNENYHRQWVEGIINKSLSSTFSSEFKLMDECYKYYDNASSPDSFKYMTDLPDATSLPAQWQPINKIRQKIKVLLGELDSKGYDFRVEAINKESKIRKLEAKEEMRVQMRIAPAMQQLDEYIGLQTQQQIMPESEEELDEFFDKNYKEEAEIVLYYALKFLDKKVGWKSVRRELFRDMLIAGKCFVKNEIINGIPTVRRIDPRFMVYDKYAENDFISDSTYFGEIRYMSAADAAVKYNLTQEQINQAHDQYKDFTRTMSAKSSPGQRNLEVNWFGSLPDGYGMRWFDETPNGLRVLVVEGCWQDFKKYKNKVSEDKYGDEHIKTIGPDSQEREGVISKTIKIWRRGTLIGGKFMTDWGEIPNQPRDNESLAETQPPYIAVIPDFVNGRAVSIVEQLKGLQNLKDIITYNVVLTMARAGAKGFIYDVSQCPDNWDVATVIKYLKTVGIAFIDSKQGGTPAQFNQFQSIDMSLSESVSKYLEMSVWVDREMDSVSGINEARQGVVQGASQAVGVTRSALLQSSLTTASLFNIFDEFSTKVWNYQAKLVKIAFPEAPERFASIIGDVGVDFLQNDIDLELDDYAVFIEVTPALLDDLSNFQQIIMAALSAGSLDFRDAMVLLQESDVMLALRKFEKLMKQRDAEAIEQEQAMMQQQAEEKMMLQNNMNQHNLQTQQMSAQTAQASQREKNAGDIRKQALKSKADLTKERMKILTQQINARKTND